MHKNDAVKILEALADGCSPITGEVFEHDYILNDSNVREALQLAIAELKAGETTDSAVDIELSEVANAIKLLQENNLNPTSNRLVGLFLGTRKIKHKNMHLESMYGKYRGRYQKGQLLDYFEKYLNDNNYRKKRDRDEPWREITFFRKDIFNRLSKKAINQLKQKINQLGLTKTENLNDYIINARKRHYRSH